MFSGTNLVPLSRFDARFGVHQKLDRVARRHLAQLDLPLEIVFPPVKDILHFEGYNGPDGIKRKSPGKDEPWHFINPYDPNDDRLVKTIELGYGELVKNLKVNNQARAAFEAAWLAHSLVDGLTPAHHFPFETELSKLRGGQGIETRTSAREKLMMHGATRSERIINNWKMWGDHGLMATHINFELGIATLMPALKLDNAQPTEKDLAEIRKIGVNKLFLKRVHRVAEMRMYQKFYKVGWTAGLANQARRELLPLIVNTITLVWYLAAWDAAKSEK